MGTRSVVAVPHEDSWRGRYVHWDGYPDHMVPVFQRLVRRDGLAIVQWTLTEDFYGWSCIDAEGDRDPGEPRFVAVSGYGTAYTTVEDQAHPDRWILPTSSDGVEFCYILREEGVEILDRRVGDAHAMGMFGWHFNTEAVRWAPLAVVGWEEKFEDPYADDEDDEEDDEEASEGVPEPHGQPSTADN